MYESELSIYYFAYYQLFKSLVSHFHHCPDNFALFAVCLCVHTENYSACTICSSPHPLLTSRVIWTVDVLQRKFEFGAEKNWHFGNLPLAERVLKLNFYFRNTPSSCFGGIELILELLKIPEITFWCHFWMEAFTKIWIFFIFSWLCFSFAVLRTLQSLNLDPRYSFPLWAWTKLPILSHAGYLGRSNSLFHYFPTCKTIWGIENGIAQHLSF